VDVATAPGSRRPTLEDRRRLVASSLSVGNPGNNARKLLDAIDLCQECQIEIPITNIRPYDRNPRRADNLKFAEIKESIRATGIRTPLTVTRRPGDSHFIVESGGNTRLLAIQQLSEETRDPRFEKIAVVFRPWRSESHVLTAHMVENEQRGEMSFWDKACGIVALKGEFEAEQGSALSLRELGEALKRSGLAKDHTTLAHYFFATERLRPLGEAIPELSGLHVKTIQPRLNALKRYAQTAAGLDEHLLYATVLGPVLRQTAERYRPGGGFSAPGFCDACEEALAQHLHMPVSELLDALAASTRAEKQDRGSVSPTAPDPFAGLTAEPCLGTAVDARLPGVSTADTRARALYHSMVENKHISPPVEQLVGGEVALLAQRLARAVGIDGHIQPDAAFALGYRTDDPPAAAGGISTTALHTWWLLSYFAQAPVPEQPARNVDPGVERREKEMNSAGEGHVPLHHPDAAELLDWLFASSGKYGDILWQFLLRIRAWHAAGAGSCRRPESDRGGKAARC
jgi:ParB family protein of integrating conjugative element (PFGI_1 class)